MTGRIERRNICLIGIPERENRKNKEVTIFSWRMAVYLPELIKKKMNQLCAVAVS